MPQESERETRKKRIDKQLAAAGWTIVDFQEVDDITGLDRHAVEEYPTENGPADYVLVVKGKILGVVEGKKVLIAAQNVLEQAKRYSKGAAYTVGNWHQYRIPFLYSTNGELIYHLDVRNPGNLSRQIYGYHTPEALSMKLTSSGDQAIQKLRNTPVDHPGLREYQRHAVMKVDEGIEEGKRQMLLAMATGTGKTFTTVNLVSRLMALLRLKVSFSLFTLNHKQSRRQLPSFPLIYSTTPSS